ncbi:hypothetical protein D6789_01555 [Candidatus Woesearchaeota archaeon]|nr:MAG: hypothetical protein D6789_01555 [Candidatus Woesearchaeota archaeon]
MTYFVRIDNATAVRRAILETTKDFLGILSSYHHMLDMREQKMDVVQQLAKTLSELSELFTKADALLPERSTKEVEQFLPTETLAPRTKPKPVKTSELDRLQESLSLIEERLNKL